MRTCSAFRNQPNGCTQPAGTCLKNQIYDYYFADVGRMTRGLDPLYFVGRYGGGSANTNQVPVAGCGCTPPR